MFGLVKEYKHQDEWEEDQARHCVPADSPYSWDAGTVLIQLGIQCKPSAYAILPHCAVVIKVFVHP